METFYMDKRSGAVAFDYGSNPLPSAREPAAKTAFATSFSG